MVHEVNEAEVAEAKEEVEALDIGTHQAHLNKLKEVHMVVWVPIVVVEAKAGVKVTVIRAHQAQSITLKEAIEVHVEVWIQTVVVEAKEEVEVLVIGIHQVHLINIREVPVEV